MQGVQRDVHYRLTGPNDNETPNSIIFKNSSIIYLRDLATNPSDPEHD